MDANGVSKKDLAGIAGVGPSAVTKWVGGGAIRGKYLKKIADYFKVSPGQLLNDSLQVKEGGVDWHQRALVAEKKLEKLRSAIKNLNRVVDNLEGAL